MFGGVGDYERTEVAKFGSTFDRSRMAFGGRSMGARAAVMAAHDNESIKLLVLVSYPLIGPKGDMRDQILLDIKEDIKVLFISGDEDSMCDFKKLADVRKKMKAKSWLVTVQGASHGMDLKGGAKVKTATEEVGKETGRIAARWIKDRDEKATDMVLAWDAETERVVGSWGGEDATAGHGDSEQKAGSKRKSSNVEEERVHQTDSDEKNPLAEENRVATRASKRRKPTRK
jgi:hypothetical protein